MTTRRQQPGLHDAQQAMRIAQQQSAHAMASASDAIQQAMKLLRDTRAQMLALQPISLDPLSGNPPGEQASSTQGDHQP